MIITKRSGLVIVAATLAAGGLIAGTASAATTSSKPSTTPSATSSTDSAQAATHGGHQNTLTGAQEAALFEDFAVARAAGDPVAMAKVITPDMVWIFPSGTSQVAGTARGVDQVIARARVENDYGMVFTFVNAFYNAQGIAVEVHGYGQHNGKTLDIDLVDVVQFRDGKVSSINTGVTDVAAVNAYFPARAHSSDH